MHDYTVIDVPKGVFIVPIIRRPSNDIKFQFYGGNVPKMETRPKPTFETKAELEAFGLGMAEMDGWCDWEEVEGRLYLQGERTS